MWWRKSPLQPTTPSRSSSFSFSTFKDIQSLCQDDSDSPSHLPDHKPTPHLKKSPSVFHRVRIAASTLRTWNSILSPPPSDANATATANANANATATANANAAAVHPDSTRIVVYFTSLRVVRSTFEDCKTVRSILRGFRVSIDERDLAMDVRFLHELKAILGKNCLPLPRVFVGGKYIGGADEIRMLHEAGELKKIVDGFPKIALGVCGVCGGSRFLLCTSCSGSHKCYSDKGGFRSCSLCNENGLIRCPECC